MPSTNGPHPERRRASDGVEGRTIALPRCPDLWLGGIAAALGLGAWAYDRHWQVGALAGAVTFLSLGVLYPLPAWLFGWPSTRWIDAICSAFDLLDLLSIFW